jgi:LuxR family maltose regulon positive regulatory protein
VNIESTVAEQHKPYIEPLESNLISTKLQRPLLTSDYIPRPRLYTRFDRQRRLTLVSAPAGYGKSTLVSSWLETLDCPAIWLSLDENDSDLAVFLSYFIAAIQTEFPDIGANTLAMLNSAQKLPLETVATSLINELNRIELDYVLVLDDYHLIQDKLVHDLSAKILRHLPTTLHLVLTSRIDPPIALANLRAQGQVVEIRALDLSFNSEETADLVNRLLGVSIDEATVLSLEARSEGWVTGLRLAILSRKHLGDSDPVLDDIRVSNRYVTDYMMSSVFSLQKPDVRQWLIYTALLDRFCPQLVEAVCLPGDRVKKADFDGRLFIDSIMRANLFVIPLDQDHQWFRFHHLFQGFLQSELRRNYGTDYVSGLHLRASDWFAKNGFVDEALRHAITAGDSSIAGQIVERYKHIPLNEDKWYVLSRWLSQLPKEVIQRRPALLLAKAWVSNYQSAFWTIPPILEAVENSLEVDAADESLMGEIDFFKGNLLYWEGQGDAAMASLNSALKRIPRANLGARNEVETYYAVASQISGKGREVVQAYEKILFDAKTEGTRYLRLLGSVILVHLLSGKLARAERVAQMLADMGARTNNAYINSWTAYILGYCHYQWNNLDNAIKYFKAAEEQKYALDNNAPVDVYAGLAFSYQAIRKFHQASKTMNELSDFVQQANNPTFRKLALSAEARLALLQGNHEVAVRWLITADLSFDEGTTFFWIDVPRLNYCSVLIGQGSEASLREASVKLEQHWRFNQANHNVPVMISILILQTRAYKKLGQTDRAIAALEQAVLLARPGGWIRPFVESGPELASLLKRLSKQGLAPEYITRILTAISEIPEPIKDVPEGYVPVPNEDCGLAERLSLREREVLSLMAKGMSHQQIADSLTISLYTVKRHAANIYRKLEVRNRRQAVVKAESLDLLPH